MGLPNIDIIFKTAGVTAIKRSARGIVAMIIKDNSEKAPSKKIYDSIADVDFSSLKRRNYDYMKLLYKGAPNRVILINIKENDVNYALRELKDMKWNYLVYPEATSEDVLTISTWIKEMRNKNKKTFKAVLPNSASDHEGIINFTMDNIHSNISTEVFSCGEYCSRIAGMLAGLSLARSSTYFVFDDILECDLKEDPNHAIDRGEFIIIFDGEDYKVGRGVNSFTTFTTEKGKDFSKIKIMEGIDLYNDDIRDTFDKYYVGKYRNDYDTKQAFVAAVNAYNKSLEGDVLDKSHKNITVIDIDAQRLYLESQGKDTKKMDDIEIKTANTGSNVFVKGNIKFVDAMEDLTMVNHL